MSDGTPGDDEVSRHVESMFEAMQAGHIKAAKPGDGPAMKSYGERLETLEREVIDPALQGPAGEIIRSAGHAVPCLVERVSMLEARLNRMQAQEKPLPAEEEPAQGHPDLQSTLAQYASNAENLTPEDMAALGEMMERTGKSARKKRDDDERERRLAGVEEAVAVSTSGPTAQEVGAKVYEQLERSVRSYVSAVAPTITAQWEPTPRQSPGLLRSLVRRARSSVADLLRRARRALGLRAAGSLAHPRSGACPQAATAVAEGLEAEGAMSLAQGGRDKAWPAR